MKFSCPNCDGHIAADEEHFGTEVPCPHCGEEITVPFSSSERKAAPEDREQGGIDHLPEPDFNSQDDAPAPGLQKWQVSERTALESFLNSEEHVLLADDAVLKRLRRVAEQFKAPDKRQSSINGPIFAVRHSGKLHLFGNARGLLAMIASEELEPTHPCSVIPAREKSWNLSEEWVKERDANRNLTLGPCLEQYADGCSEVASLYSPRLASGCATAVSCGRAVGTILNLLLLVGISGGGTFYGLYYHSELGFALSALIAIVVAVVVTGTTRRDNAGPYSFVIDFLDAVGHFIGAPIGGLIGWIRGARLPVPKTQISGETTALMRKS